MNMKCSISDWKFFDNTKELLAFIASEYGDDALFGRKLFADHSAPLMPACQKNLVKQAYECGAVKIIQENVNSDQSHKETAVRQAVGRLIYNYGTSDELAKRVIWEFTNAIGWGMAEPQTPLPMGGSGGQAVEVFGWQVMDGKRIAIAPKKGSVVPFGKYDWRILNVDVQNGHALLLCDKVIKKRPYHTEDESITWKECKLRRYLNRYFYNSFGHEKSRIVDKQWIINNHNPWWPEIPGGDYYTSDKIFLLSIEEVVEYIGDSGQLKNKNPNNEYWIDDQYNVPRIAEDSSGEKCWWWLRSPGYISSRVACVSALGHINLNGLDCSDKLGGVRPALWIKL